LLKKCANTYDYKVPGQLHFMGCWRPTNLVCH
jgi:hypothetical protein